MKPAWWLLWFSLSVVPSSAGTPGVPTSRPRPCVGWIEELRPTAYWRAAPGAPAVTLQPARHRYWPLRSGEQLRVGTGGSLTVLLGGKLRAIQPAAWFSVPAPERARGEVVDSITAYGRRLGIERPEDTLIHSPAEGSQVRPEELVIRWTPDPARGRVTLWVREAGGAELWRLPGVDGSRDRLEDPELRRTLAARRPAGPLELMLRELSGRVHTRHFGVLPAADEAALRTELQAAARAPGFLPRVERAHAFLRRRLYEEALHEYQAALQEAPESQALLEKAIALHELVGDTAAADALRRRLKEGAGA